MASAVGTFSSISEASCAAPMVKAPKTAQPGTVITVKGLYFAAECNDTGGCTVGCAGEVCDTDEPAPPYTGLRITLVPAKAEPTAEGTVLAEGIDADPRSYRVREQITLPEDLQPGRYRITVGNSPNVIYRSAVIDVLRPTT